MNKRIQAIDLARGASTSMLVVIHTLWMYGDQHTQASTLLGSIVHLMGKGTGMFLITMGFSFTFSRNQSLKLSFRRGLILLAAGYGMNFMKFIVPTVAGVIPDNFIKAYGWTPPATFENMLYMLSTGDILQLAGLSLFLMGVVNHFSKNKYVPLILAIIVAAIAPFVRGTRVGIQGVDYVLDLLWGVHYNVYFTLFPWVAFILAGIFFGRLYQDVGRDIGLTFKRMWQYGLVFLVVGGALCLYDFKYHFADFFHLGFGGTLYLIGFSLLLTWFAHWLSTVVKPNKVFDFFLYLSPRVTSFYIIQWVMVCWGMCIVGFQRFNASEVLLTMPLMMLLCLGVQWLWDRVKAAKKGKPKTPKKQEKELVTA
ncbi:heparan-alpha-glucosaminide N-acetyltransferase domain-containing protein [Microscilla marina]|uniref:Membrane protein, putative n=1 Tax=Microscilla marina ATCC 23134 TaxID=313606 RepID=A1ZRI2_MICM2|nr:heparan-alpha-glucosaminide N-acetyltransferase domain-containing protein [Microscilla marina]EAY27072.1 membrane protein, putative [Microscilla marina ATCC 23134]